MKVIVNRGFDKTFTRIVVLKNGQEVKTCAIDRDYCTFDVAPTDRIEIKLKYLGDRSFAIAAADCSRGETDTVYVSPSRQFRRWTAANYKMFPCLFLLFFVLQKAVASDAFGWTFAGVVFLWALSLVGMSSSVYFPLIRRRMFKAECI